MSEIERVGILNAYDARNRGDRAIIEAQICWINKTLPGAHVTIFSQHHEYNQLIFRSSSSVEPLFSAYNGSGVLQRLLYPMMGILLYLAKLRTDERVKAFHSCDAYFACGGGYLYSSPAPFVSRQLWLHVANILAALKTGKPVMAFPQSWGPLRKLADKWICRLLASALPVIVTRGHHSDKLLKSWGFNDKIISIPDIVVAAAELLPEVDEWRMAPLKKGSLGIAPTDWNFDRTVNSGCIDEYIAKLVSISRMWCDTLGHSVTVFPQVEVQGADDDGIIARRLMNALIESGIPSSFAKGLDWDTYWKLVAAQQAFIGSRMHSCIFAMVCGVPTIGLSYQPKFSELFEQLGCPERAHLIDEFSQVDVSNQLKMILSEFNKEDMLRLFDKAGRMTLDGIDEAWTRTCHFYTGVS